MEILHKEITDKIIDAFYEVYDHMGYGYLEKVYQNALYLELKAKGLKVETHKEIKVYYKGKEVGSFFADMIVNEVVILELKAAEAMVPAHQAQLLNYLRGTEIEVGYVLNFGSNPEFSRKIFSNQRKKHKK